VTKRRLAIAAVLLFFFGLPLAGMLYVYNAAHATMRTSAIAFAREQVPQILGERDYETLRFYGTLTLKEKLSKQEFDGWLQRYGAFESLGEFTVKRSTVGARNDQAWQVVYLECPVRFSKGLALLSMKAARRSTALAEWRIEEFAIGPANVE
jgi:hypothetical protein